ncbi:restriction endonuclease subunit S [Lactobacillus iners]|jgi:hypothetical protein|uniref:Restriction endonuclease subunit S n=1 Tax=Lactobacillus iners TaxID=147802 RepID=A0A6G7B8Q3_9LACO|nr:restriction endonuclease subunit S [Lactobacillus iners]QIH23772.1 restriction endonuclease subunit S [Lactobacillus iners]
MRLINIRLGDYIKRSTENNSDLKYGEELIKGVNSSGVFASPKGSTLEVDLKPYKIVNNEAFVYNPTRLNLGSLAYRTEGLCIVSHLYIIFYLTDEGKKIINPQWLYIYFHRNEFKREVTFRNFGSQRPEFNFNDMSDIIVPLPDIKTQQKYVNVYNAMVANQKAYERGLDDLKLTCDALIDNYKHKSTKKSVGDILQEVDVRNVDGIISNVQGINITKQFMPSVANTNGVDLSKYKLVSKGQFAFSGMQTGRDECIRIALFDKEEPIIISPAYSILQIKDDNVLAEYVMMWFSRKEVDRLGWFMSDASIRTNLDMDRFYEIEIPVPDLEVQKAIIDIYNAYNARRAINEKLKAQIKAICPILIKGSIEEGRNTKEA